MKTLIKTLIKSLFVTLLLTSLATPQVYEDVVKSRISLAQEIGFGYGLIVEKKIVAVFQKNLPELLTACDRLDSEDDIVKRQQVVPIDSSLLLAELGDMREICLNARVPGAHF